jgi:hypothetical protein
LKVSRAPSSSTAACIAGDDRRSQRLGDVADAEADDLRRRDEPPERAHAPADLGKQIAAGSFA